MGSAKHKWKISYHKHFPKQSPPPDPPKEFLCPISGSLMADPVIVFSGHTFERSCALSCKSHAFDPPLPDGSSPNFSAIIPNLALKSAILSWCERSSLEPPKPLDRTSAEKLVRTLMDQNLLQGVAEGEKKKNNNNKNPRFIHAETELTRGRRSHFRSSSGESISTVASSTPPLQLATLPSCCSSSSSSSEIESRFETLNPSEEEEEIVSKLKSPQVFEQEETLASLRKMTRTREDARVSLCTPRLLSAVRSLLASRYPTVQANAAACLVNLSLENPNKVKIVRSGIVPPLIDVLRSGSPEAQEHASGALFSLALDDANKTAIGVLGALQPLLHVLRSGTERARHDSALALYHLSLVQSNRAKLVKLGAVPALLAMVRSDRLTSRVLIILCNIAACPDGRAAMLDGGVVGCLLGLLRGDELKSESSRESCVSVLYGLSHGGLRFKALAKQAGVEEVLRAVVERAAGSERGKAKARKVLETMKVKDKEEEEDVDWEELLGLRGASRTVSRLGSGMGGLNAKSTEF